MFPTFSLRHTNSASTATSFFRSASSQHNFCTYCSLYLSLLASGRASVLQTNPNRFLSLYRTGSYIRSRDRSRSYQKIEKSSSISNAQFRLQQWRESHGSCLTSTPSWSRYRNISITTSHASSNLRCAVSQKASLSQRPSSGMTFHFGPRNPKSPLPNSPPIPKPLDEWTLGWGFDDSRFEGHCRMKSRLLMCWEALVLWREWTGRRPRVSDK